MVVLRLGSVSCPGRLLHEGRVLLEEGWGYSAGVGGSCSTHNLRPVDPHPRGVGRPEAGRASADVEPPPGGCAGTRREPKTAGQRSGWGRRGRRRGGLAPTSSHRREAAREPGGNQKGPGQRPGWGRWGRPLGRGRPAPPLRPRQTSRSRARQQLSVHGADINGPAVGTPSGIVGIPRIRLDSRRRCRVDVSAMDTGVPPGHCQRPAPQSAVTLKVPTRPAIPAARSSIILASWRRASQPSGMPLRPYSAPASCP